MDHLVEKSKIVVSQTDTSFSRYLMNVVNWEDRLTGIIGGRGTGKTTLLLQHLKKNHFTNGEGLYLSLDDIFFTENKLIDFAEKFRQRGGKYLYLDEVHKYSGWAREIKNIYDFYKDLHIIFSGSSIINLLNLEVDLSRRAVIYELSGLSLREYLAYTGIYEIPSFSLDEILENHEKLALDIVKKIKPLKYWNDYLSFGFYPFFKEDKLSYHIRLEQAIKLVVYNELQFIEGFDVHKAQKIFQLLYILATNVPFKPNLTKLAQKTNMHRNTLVQYLYYLEKARLIHNLAAKGKSISTLQKPDKIYLNNSNLAFALAPDLINKGTIRETFFLSQLSESHMVSLPSQGDFIADNKYIFEIGGKGKSDEQTRNLKNSFVAADDIEIGYKNRIPLWLFGFLY